MKEYIYIIMAVVVALIAWSIDDQEVGGWMMMMCVILVSVQIIKDDFLEK